MNRTPNIARARRGLLFAGLFAAAFVTVAGTPASADMFEAGALVIHEPWARATPPGAKVAGGYATIENNGDTPDRLVSATAEISGRVEIHEMAMSDGVMTMRPLPDGAEIPAGASLELKPGSYHIMFMELAAPLSEGETFAGTLTFENAGSVDVTFAIGPIGSEEAPMHDHSH